MDRVEILNKIIPLVSSGLRKPAIDFLECYLEKNTADPFILSILGKIYLLEKRPEQAVKYLLMSLEKQSEINKETSKSHELDVLVADDLLQIDTKVDVSTSLPETVDPFYDHPIRTENKPSRREVVGQIAIKIHALDSGHLAYLDGLRTLAVISILIYHQDNSWLPGGYLGVEIFFVISGFIITRLLYKEWLKCHRIDFKRFYWKRLLRLFPSMLALIWVVWVWMVLFHPSDSRQILTDLPYALSFTGNLNYIFNQHSYFETIGRQPVFEHLWSLGVEFQFYLLWPIICLLLFRLPSLLAVALLVLGGMGSYIWMASLYVPDQDSLRIYFGTDTRAGAFLTGALAMLLSQYWYPRGAVQIMSAIGALAFCAVVATLSLLEATDPRLYSGGFAGVALLTGGVIIHCHNSHRHDPVLFILGNRFTAWLGNRSYGIYLWHWPVFCLSVPLVDIDLQGSELFLLRLAVTLACSEICHHLVEEPFRHGLLERAWQSLSQGATNGRLQAAYLWCLVMFIVSGCGYYLAQATEAAIRQTASEVAEAASFGEEPQIPQVFAALRIGYDMPTNPVGTPFGNDFLREPLLGSNILPFVTDDTDDDTAEPASKMCANGGSERNRKIVWDKNSSNGYVTRVYTRSKKKAAILAIGDSVMVGAAAELLRQMPGLMLDAKVGRQLRDAIQLLDGTYKSQVNGIVLIHLGNNGPLSQQHIDKLITSLKNSQKIVIVNLKLPRNYESSNNRLLEQAAQQSKAELINWRSVGLAGTGIFASDGLHLTGKGISLYADTILKTLCASKKYQNKPTVRKAIAMTFRGKN